MSIFNCFFSIIWKNKITIIIYTIVFVVLSVALSGTLQSQTDSIYKDASIPIAVIDRDNSKLSAALTGYLNGRQKLVDLPDNTQSLQDAIFYRDVEYILIIPESFENNLKGLKDLKTDSDITLLENVKLPNSTSGIYIDNQIDGYLATVEAYLNAGYKLSEAADLTSDDMKSVTTVEMYGGEQKAINKSAYYFNFMAYIILALIIGAIGPVLIAFNKSDLARRIESSSLKLRERNMQIALGCIISSAVIWLGLIIIAFMLYGSEIISSVGLLSMANNFIYLIVCICVAFLTGQFMKSTSALAALNNAVSLGMSFLCGTFVPQDLLGSGVLFVAKFLPAYWYVRSNDMLYMSAFNGRIYIEGIGIQLGFAAAIFAVALVVSRQKKLNSIV